MPLETMVPPTAGNNWDLRNPSRFNEECPTCGGQAYVRCGAIGKCSDDLCPSNDNGDYGQG